MRVAVIGAGAMGSNHVRVLRDLPGVEITGVIDRDQARAEAVASRYGTVAGTDAEAHLDDAHPDAVVVAVPTSGHVPVALAAMERGIHVLVEKPIADTVEEAQLLVDAAERHGTTLAVGHIERCNPAVVALKAQLDAGELGRTFMLHSRRLSPFPARIIDVGVAADLATHEVDMMRYLTGAEVEHVSASVCQVLHPTHEDIIVGLLRFDSGVLGVLDVNWVTPTKIRQISVTGERGMFTVDYLTQELCFYANAAAGETFSAWPPTDAFSIAEGPMVRYHIAKREPLLVELESFLRAAETGARPVVDGRDGLEAVRVAAEIVAGGTDPETR